MIYFDQIDALNDVLVKFIHDGFLENVSKFLKKNVFDHFPQLLTYDVIFAPTNEPFLPIFTKRPILTKLTPFMTFLGEINP